LGKRLVPILVGEKGKVRKEGKREGRGAQVCLLFADGFLIIVRGNGKKKKREKGGKKETRTEHSAKEDLLNPIPQPYQNGRGKWREGEGGKKEKKGEKGEKKRDRPDWEGFRLSPDYCGPRSEKGGEEKKKKKKEKKGREYTITAFVSHPKEVSLILQPSAYSLTGGKKEVAGGGKNRKKKERRKENEMCGISSC